MRSGRIIASLALALMMLLPGCLEEVTSSEQEFDWNRDYVLIDPSGHEDPRMFVVADPCVENETLGERHMDGVRERAWGKLLRALPSSDQGGGDPKLWRGISDMVGGQRSDMAGSTGLLFSPTWDVLSQSLLSPDRKD